MMKKKILMLATGLLIGSVAYASPALDSMNVGADDASSMSMDKTSSSSDTLATGTPADSATADSLDGTPVSGDKTSNQTGDESNSNDDMSADTATGDDY